MIDSPELRPTLDHLSKLIPTVVAGDDADPELVRIGERYWALAGFAEQDGIPMWCEKTKDIDTAGWGAPDLCRGCGRCAGHRPRPPMPEVRGAAV